MPNGIRRVNGSRGECSASLSELEGTSAMLSNPSATEESGISAIPADDSEGTKTKASSSRVRPNGSRYSANWTISAASTPRMAAPSPGGGQLPAITTRPPVIPTPGSDPTEPSTTIVPSLIPAPALLPTCPLTITVPPDIQAPTSSPAEPCTVMVPPVIRLPSRSPTSFSTTMRPSLWKAPSIEVLEPWSVKFPPLFIAPAHSPRSPSRSTLDLGGRWEIAPISPFLGFSSPPRPHPILTSRSLSKASESIPSRSRPSLILFAVTSRMTLPVRTWPHRSSF